MRRVTGAALYAAVVRDLRAELSQDYGLPMGEYTSEIWDVYSLGADMQPILSVKFTRNSGATITVSGITPKNDGTVDIRSADVEMR